MFAAVTLLTVTAQISAATNGGDVKNTTVVAPAEGQCLGDVDAYSHRVDALGPGALYKIGTLRAGLS